MRLRTVLLGTALFMLATCLPALAQSRIAGSGGKPETAWTMTMGRNAQDERVVTLERVLPWDIQDFSSIEILQDYGKGCYTLEIDPEPYEVNCAQWLNEAPAYLTSSHPTYSVSTENYTVDVAAKGKTIRVTIVLSEAFLSVFANFVQVAGHGNLLNGSTADFSLGIPIMGLYYH